LFPHALADTEWLEGDFADASSVAKAIAPGAIVYHLIHTTLPHATASATDAAIAPTLALLDICRRAGVSRVVFVSSGGTVYGRAQQIPTPESAPLAPLTPYAAANVAVEQSLARSRESGGPDFRVLRVTNPYGPFQTANKNQGVIAAMIGRALRGDTIEIWGDGSVVRDFVFIDDVSDALIKAAEDRGTERIFNIGSGEGRSLRQVIAAIEAALGQPLRIKLTAGRPSDVPTSVVAIDRAGESLGWTPTTDFAAGLRATVAWWRQASAGR
jgi:UDP-glucose 4-epimerase